MHKGELLRAGKAQGSGSLNRRDVPAALPADKSLLSRMAGEKQGASVSLSSLSLPVSIFLCFIPFFFPPPPVVLCPSYTNLASRSSPVVP